MKEKCRLDLETNTERGTVKGYLIENGPCEYFLRLGCWPNFYIYHV